MEKHLKNLEHTLARFRKSETLIDGPAEGTHYTEGIQYLAIVADCYWLITDVSEIGKKLLTENPSVIIDIHMLPEFLREIIGYETIITYSNRDGEVLESQQYTTTNFPLDDLRLFFIDNVLLLPSER